MTSPAGASRDRASVIEDGFAGVQRWSLRIVLIAAGVFVVGWAIGQLWVVVFPAILALIVTTVLSPGAVWLRRRKVPSALAALTMLLAFLLGFTGLVAILTPQVAGQAPELARSASAGLQTVRDWLTDGPLDLSDGQITRAIEAVQDKLRDSAQAISSGVFSTLGAATSALVTIVLVLMLTFYFLKDGHKFPAWVTDLGGREAGQHTAELMSRTWNTLGGFIRTQTVVALIDAIIIGVGLTIIGVPLALPLAVITFVGAYVPILGALISGVLAVLVTLVTNSPQDALMALILVLAVQQLEGNVISPWLQGKNLNLHAAVILLAVTLGG
ncbi:MAG TPA: AI-2E family transporter, partial [Aeromicrobium sp.]|nr:AI-2E family transporter [Aeromicrobium sp.]